MRVLKKGLKITFINPNTEEQIVQAMAGVLAYNLAENDNKIILYLIDYAAYLHIRQIAYYNHSVFCF